MKTFNNMRTRAFAKKWDAYFVVSGRKKKAFASAFIQVPASPTAEAHDPREAPKFLEFHGKAEQVGKDLRSKLIKLGVLQDGPGAPKGNANAAGEHEMKAKKKTKTVASNARESIKRTAKYLNVPAGSGAKPVKVPTADVPRMAYGKKHEAKFIGATNETVGAIEKSLAAVESALAPKIVTIQSTTKLIDGKLSTSVAKRPWAAPQVTTKAATKPSTEKSRARIVAKVTKKVTASVKRSHHKKPLAKDAGGKPKRSHHKKVA